MPSHAASGPGHAPSRRPIRMMVVGITLGLALAPGCYYDGRKEAQGGSAPIPRTVQPPNPVLFPGQSLQFTATGMGTGIIWSVVPAAGGAFSDDGTFLAADVPGQYTIVARSGQFAGLSVTAPLTILPMPDLSGATPNAVLTQGAAQSGLNGFLDNHAIFGEPLQTQVSTSPSGTITVRHGFAPPGRTAAP